MKDWLTTVLQTARNCKDSDSLEYVATAFLPLLRIDMFSNAKCPADILRKALTKYCLSNAFTRRSNEMYECIPTVEPTAKLKSGALNKLNDDCLRVAFSFLGFEDRCNAVERSCQRLCRLSRTTAIFCDEMDRVFSEERTFKMLSRDETSVARRFVFDSYFCYELGVGGHSAAVSSALRVCHRHLTSFTACELIRFDNLEFPKLKTLNVDCRGENIVGEIGPIPQLTWLDFIAKRSQIENVRILGAEFNEEIISRLSEMKHLRSIQFETTPMATAPLRQNYDFSHLTSFAFDSELQTDNAQFACIAPFVTENLRSLRLCGFASFPRLSLPKLESVYILDSASEFLANACTPSLTKCEIDVNGMEDVCTALKMTTVREFAFQSVDIAVAVFHGSEHLAEWSQKLHTICCESHLNGVKISLASCIHEEDGSERSPLSATVRALYAHWFPVACHLLQMACVGCEVTLRENVRLSLL